MTIEFEGDKAISVELEDETVEIIPGPEKNAWRSVGVYYDDFLNQMLEGEDSYMQVLKFELGEKQFIIPKIFDAWD